MLRNVRALTIAAAASVALLAGCSRTATPQSAVGGNSPCASDCRLSSDGCVARCQPIEDDNPSATFPETPITRDPCRRTCEAELTDCLSKCQNTEDFRTRDGTISATTAVPPVAPSPQ